MENDIWLSNTKFCFILLEFLGLLFALEYPHVSNYDIRL